MKGLAPLFLGIFATFAFSWIGLALVPNFQIGHLDPQSDEDGTDIYPIPQSGMVERGRKIYAANGCFYCHSQQVRPDYDSTDIERKWGDRRSAPRDYIYGRPVLLGEMRLGPDLSNIGKRAPADDQSGAVAAPAANAAAPAAAALLRQPLRARPPLRLRRLRRKQRLPVPTRRALPRPQPILKAARRGIRLPGIINISMRHARSIGIRTCPRIASFMRSAGSAANVLLTPCR